MKVYVEAKSKAALIRRLAAGEEISGYNYSMFGGGGHYMLDDSLEDGTIIAIYSQMSGGNPVAKSWGTWTNGVLKAETFESPVSCKICGKTFDSFRGLNGHMNAHLPATHPYRMKKKRAETYEADIKEYEGADEKVTVNCDRCNTPMEVFKMTLQLGKKYGGAKHICYECGEKSRGMAVGGGFPHPTTWNAESFSAEKKTGAKLAPYYEYLKNHKGRYTRQQWKMDAGYTWDMAAESPSAENPKKAKPTFILVTFEVFDGNNEYTLHHIISQTEYDMTDEGDLIKDFFGEADYDGSMYWIDSERAASIVAAQPITLHTRKLLNKLGFYAESFEAISDDYSISMKRSNPLSRHYIPTKKKSAEGRRWKLCDICLRGEYFCNCWRCSHCETSNAIDNDLCSICGTSQSKSVSIQAWPMYVKWESAGGVYKLIENGVYGSIFPEWPILYLHLDDAQKNAYNPNDNDFATAEKAWDLYYNIPESFSAEDMALIVGTIGGDPLLHLYRQGNRDAFGYHTGKIITDESAIVDTVESFEKLPNFDERQKKAFKKYKRNVWGTKLDAESDKLPYYKDRQGGPFWEDGIFIFNHPYDDTAECSVEGEWEDHEWELEAQPKKPGHINKVGWAHSMGIQTYNMVCQICRLHEGDFMAYRMTPKCESCNSMNLNKSYDDEAESDFETIITTCLDCGTTKTESREAEEESMWKDSRGREFPFSTLCKTCQKPEHQDGTGEECPITEETTGCPCCDEKSELIAIRDYERDTVHMGVPPMSYEQEMAGPPPSEVWSDWGE